MLNKKILYRVIFEADTPAGKWFDIGLIACIILAVLVVMLDSMVGLRTLYGRTFQLIEWSITLLFTIEYGLRIYCSPRPYRYITSFFGIVDILSVSPTYIGLFFPGTHFFAIVRVLRVLRVFRILKLVQYIEESKSLIRSIKQSFRKIVLFMFAVLTIAIILGSIMYIIEGEERGFTSIPKSIYWAIVTLTTVGYGDISPETNAGQVIATISMILGYSIIVVSTGFIGRPEKQTRDQQWCDSCKKMIKTKRSRSQKVSNKK